MANAFEPLGIRHFRPVRPGTFTRAFRFNSPHVLSTTSRHKPPVQWTSNLTANRWNLHHNAWYSSSLQVQSKEESRNKGEGTTSTATSASTARGTLGDSRALRNNIYTNSSLQAVRGTLNVTRALPPRSCCRRFSSLLVLPCEADGQAQMNKDT